MSEDFARLNLRPFHTPLGVMLDESDPQRSKCIRCNTCDGFPCLLFAKADAQVLGVDPELQYPNVHLITNSFVERLDTSATGREVSQVIAQQSGAFRGLRSPFVSSGIVPSPYPWMAGRKSVIVRDSDGHAIEVAGSHQP